jgi:hypothetical protein
LHYRLLRAAAAMSRPPRPRRRAGRLLSALGAFGAFVLHAGPVEAADTSPAAGAAEPARVRLEYARQPSALGCVSPEQLTRDVEARLGRRVFVGAEPAELVARVDARRAAGRFILQVELRDRAGRPLGQRELSTRAAHCSALDESLALVLALAADAPRVPEEPAPQSRAPAPNESLGTPLVIPASTHAPRLGWRWLPSVGASLASGLFPSVAFGLELGLELRPPWFWPLALRGTWWVEQGLGGQPRPGRHVDFTARTLELGVCPWAGRVGSFGASACVVFWFGRIDARGSGFDESFANEGWLAAAGLAPALDYRFGPLSVTASVSLLVPLVRRRYFSTDGADITLHEQPWLLGAAGLRLGAEF